VKSVSEAIFEAISTFASSGPQNLRQICITVQQRGMVDDFISVIEKAERNVDHSLKSVWTQLKGFQTLVFFSTDFTDHLPLNSLSLNCDGIFQCLVS